jgi:hypothetical protein
LASFSRSFVKSSSETPFDAGVSEPNDKVVIAPFDCANNERIPPPKKIIQIKNGASTLVPQSIQALVQFLSRWKTT